MKKLPAGQYDKILEIGCGVGFTSELIAEKYQNAQITATDFDEESIDFAQRRIHLPRGSFQQADATNLSFSDNTFDAVFSVLTLHHISNFQNAIAELARVLKPGGTVYIMDIPTNSFNFFHWRKSVVPGLFSKTDIIGLLEKNDCSVTDPGGIYRFFLEGNKR